MVVGSHTSAFLPTVAVRRNIQGNKTKLSQRNDIVLFLPQVINSLLNSFTVLQIRTLSVTHARTISKEKQKLKCLIYFLSQIILDVSFRHQPGKQVAECRNLWNDVVKIGKSCASHFTSSILLSWKAVYSCVLTEWHWTRAKRWHLVIRRDFPWYNN